AANRRMLFDAPGALADRRRPRRSVDILTQTMAAGCRVISVSNFWQTANRSGDNVGRSHSHKSMPGGCTSLLVAATSSASLDKETRIQAHSYYQGRRVC